MHVASFTVEGEPKAQPRPKAARIGGFIRIYTPHTAKAWKAAVMKAAGPFVTKGAPITGALKVSLGFTFARAQSQMTASGGLRKGISVYHVKRPDVDNLAKAVLDALTDIGLWHDDSQIIELKITKSYGTYEGCDVCIEEIQYPS